MLREWEESFRELELELAPPLFALLGPEVCSLPWDWPFFFQKAIQSVFPPPLG